MLNIPRDRSPALNGQFGAAGQTESNFDLGYLVGVLRRRRVIAALVTALGVVLGVLYLLATPPTFTALTQVLLDTRRLELFRQETSSSAPIDAASVESQVQVIRSEHLASKVVQELKLYEDPEFIGDGEGLVQTVLSAVFGMVGEEPSAEAKVQKALEAFEDRLDARRLGLGYVIGISFTSRDAEKSATIANKIANAYIVDQLDSRFQATQRASNWLQNRITELRDQASDADTKVATFKGENNIIDTGGVNSRLVSEQQLTELSSQLTIARSQTGQAKARLDRIEATNRSNQPDAAVTDALSNDVITRLRQQYLEAARTEADLSSRYGSGHTAAVNLRNQMRETQRAIENELRRLEETYRSDYEIARTREQQLQEQVDRLIQQAGVTQQAQVKLRELESTANSYRQLYDSFLQRYMQSIQQQTFPSTEARVITAASPPNKKSHPKTGLTLAVALAGGLALGVAAAFARELLDRVIRTTAQAEQAAGVECLGVLPRVKADEKKGVLGEATDLNGRPVINPLNSALSAVVDAPFSRYAETIRSVKVAADVAALTHRTRIIGVVSCVPNEGKSTVSANLGRLLSQSGARTLLVDGDLRNPSLTRDLAASAKSGLIEVLGNKAPVETVLWADPKTGMSFMPAIVSGRLSHTSEVLASEPMHRFLEESCNIYDYVVVDLPPLVPVVDVRAAAHLIDAFVLVVEWGATTTELVHKALGSSSVIQGKLLGTVLNKVDVGELRKFEGLSDTYYSSKYYKDYAAAE